MTCLICGGDRHRVVFTERGSHILRCRDCAHVFSSCCGDPHYTGFWGAEVRDDEHHYWRKARMRMFEDFLDRYIAGHSGRLLDMGCGLGFFLKRVSAVENWQACGCEISPAAVRYCHEVQRLPAVACSALDEYDAPDASFDVITMWDVIDHLAQPDPVLRNCQRLLREDGILFIRTPNISIQLPRAKMGRVWRGRGGRQSVLQPHDHMHHYSAASIRRLLGRNGFDLAEFAHLHPVETGRDRLDKWPKRIWCGAVTALARVTAGHVNLDNLFVVARKLGPTH